jgi:hypothetical protein
MERRDNFFESVHTSIMKNPSGIILAITFGASSLSLFGAQPSQRLDGIWVGSERLSLAKRTDCPPPEHQTLPAKIAVAQGGSLLAVVEGFAPGRYTNLHWSGDALVFELPNKRKGELRLSSDGKTLIEKGDVRRTVSVGGYFFGAGGVGVDKSRHGATSGPGSAPQMTGFTACVDEVTGTFHREK